MDIAIAMFKSMFGMNGLVLSEKYFVFLSSFADGFFALGDVYPHIDGNSRTTIAILLAFVLVLVFKNSTAFLKDFTSTRASLLYGVFLFLIATSFMSRISEFLYFNF